VYCEVPLSFHLALAILCNYLSVYYCWCSSHVMMRVLFLFWQHWLRKCYFCLGLLAGLTGNWSQRDDVKGVMSIPLRKTTWDLWFSLLTSTHKNFALLGYRVQSAEPCSWKTWPLNQCKCAIDLFITRLICKLCRRIIGRFSRIGGFYVVRKIIDIPDVTQSYTNYTFSVKQST